MLPIAASLLLALLWLHQRKNGRSFLCAVVILVTLLWGLMFAITANTLVGRGAAASRRGEATSQDFRDGYLAAMGTVSRIQLHLICPIVLLGLFAFTSSRQGSSGPIDNRPGSSGE
jgi:hypothetical protein